MVLREGIAKRLPAGGVLHFQIHYSPNGKMRIDRSKLGLIFAKSKPSREAFTFGIGNPDLVIPPHAENFADASSFVTPSDCRLVSIMPHMHLRGKDFMSSVTRPGDNEKVVLSVPQYDFGWQSYYTFAKPLELPRGSKIGCKGHFDNSNQNPYNPDPNQLVRFGPQSFEEMMVGYIDLDVPVGTRTFRAPR